MLLRKCEDVIDEIIQEATCLFPGWIINGAKTVLNARELTRVTLILNKIVLVVIDIPAIFKSK